MKTLARVTIAAAFCLICLDWIHAQPTDVPIGTVPRKYADFSLTVNLEEVGGNGYQPGRLVFKPNAGRFKTNRSFTVKLGPRMQRDHFLLYDATYQCEAVQGATEATIDILLPNFYQTEALKITIFDDGRVVDSPYAILTVNSLRVQDAEQQSTFGVFIPKDDSIQDAYWKVCPDVRTMITVFGGGPIPTDNKIKRLTHSAADSLISKVQSAKVQFRRLDETSLPTNWLYYSQLDVMLCAAPLLERIEKEQPPAFEAIKDWISTGGNLWIYGAESHKVQFLNQLTFQPIAPQLATSKALVNDRLQLNQRNDDSELTYQYWTGVQKSSINTGQGSNPYPPRSEVLDALIKENHPFATHQPADDLVKPLKKSKYGAGQILLMELEDPFPGSAQFWMTINDASGPSSLMWQSRTGLRLPQGNGSFWSHLVPGVGAPPLKTFLFLNALFAITLGPVCYNYFRRRERLYLLYFVAPSTAVCVAGLLFVYALVADGISTKAKIEQITWLDTANGVGVRECHESYVAALPSRNGLSYSNRTAVYPVCDFNTNVYRYRGYGLAAKNQVFFEADQQRFTGDFLPSRSQTQFKTFAPIKDDLRVRFDESVSPPHVVNERDHAIDTIFFKDKGSQLWLAQNLAPGAKLSMVKFDPAEHTDITQRIWPEDPLPIPNRPNNWTANSPSPFATVLGPTTLIADRYRNFRTTGPRRSFLMSVPVDQTSTGLPNAKVIEGLHILMGDLP